MKVAIIDYDMGNLGSVRRAFEECGASAVTVITDPADAAACDRLVLPGVGAFADGMRTLTERGWDAAIRTAVEKFQIPLLGICLGMQLLARTGEEGGMCEGLGLIAGDVRRMVPGEGERIPHVGWNEVRMGAPSPLFEGVADGSDFYFVHGYRFIPKDPASVLATTPYAGGFVSAAGRGQVYGVQFHPEKSSKNGFKLIRNFLSLRKC